MHLPIRYRTPILALAAVVLGLLVVAAILLVGRIGVAGVVRSSPTLSAFVRRAATDPMATPEGAVRAFFAALAAARRTDDPTVVAPFVTGTDSSAYLSVAGFLGGQRAVEQGIGRDGATPR